MIKYMNNCFFATKVSFMNEMYQIAEKIDADWDAAVSGFVADGRIGHTHLNVPGHDGKFGFGGPCLPKDCRALFTYSKDINKPMTLLKQVIEINNSIRDGYKDLSDREIDQNVNYKDDK